MEDGLSRPNLSRWRNRQSHSEDSTGARSGRGFHVSTVLFEYGFADAQAQSGAAPRTLGCVEGVENIWENVGRNAGSIILKRRPH
jgi:hypothetical protein